MKESEIMRQILEYLKHINGRYFRINTELTQVGGRYFKSAPRGTPNIIGFNGKGYFVSIEVKGPAGRMSPEQEDFRESVNLSSNGIHIIARKIEDVTDVLR